ncbi:MAG: hypothetical protein Q8O74_08920, partial [bacterium]|nr:hypothetical protein [bacterium]
MKRTNQGLNIATVCVKGKKPLSVADNKRSLKIFEDSLMQAVEKYPKLDVIIFPGGFFHFH